MTVKLALFIFAIIFAVATAFKIPLLKKKHTPESAQEQFKILSGIHERVLQDHKFGVKLDRAAYRDFASKTSPGEYIPLHNYANTQYSGQISLGAPSQDFTGMFNLIFNI